MPSPRELLGANILISAPKPTQREVRSGSFSTEAANSAARPRSASTQKLTSAANEKLVAMGHEPTFRSRQRRAVFPQGSNAGRRANRQNELEDCSMRVPRRRGQRSAVSFDN